MSHLDRVDRLDSNAVNQPGRLKADLHRLLRRLGNLVEPFLELDDLAGLDRQVGGGRIEQLDPNQQAGGDERRAP